MNRFRCTVFAVLALLGISAVCSAQRTQVYCETRTILEVPGEFPVNNSFAESETSSTGEPLFYAVSGDLPWIAPSAFGSSSLGIIRAKAVANSRIPGGDKVEGTKYRGPWSQGRANFRDEVIISSPTIPDGTIGKAVASFGYSGGFIADDLGLSDLTFWTTTGMLNYYGSVGGNLWNAISISRTYDATYQGFSDANGAGKSFVVRQDWDPKLDPDHPDQGVILFELPDGGPWGFSDTAEIEFTFVFGEMFFLESRIQTLARELVIAGNPGVGVTMVADMANSGLWNGFLNVTLEDGTPVPDFEAIGATGLSYADPIVPCPADVTGDGEVNLADLNLILANFGQTTPDGDTNNDGIVDLADLNAVLAAFGTACP